MVGMAVRVEDRIDAGELIAQRLFAEVGTSVDENDAIASAIIPSRARKDAGGDHAGQWMCIRRMHPSVGIP